MRFSLIILLLCLLFSLSCYFLSATPAALSQAAMLQAFTSKTGFQGDCTPVSDGRIFTQLKGKFDLPAPKDSVSLCHNSDLIANALNAVYQQNGATYVLKRISYRRGSWSCQYIQYWKDFYLVRQPYYLLITYHPESKTYSVHNSLYMQPIKIPDQALSLDSAKALFAFVLNDANRNPDLSSVPLTYTATDTMANAYILIQDEYRTTHLVLNLYPLDPSGKTSGFLLQWKYPVDRYYHDNTLETSYLIDAATGELRSAAKERWLKREPAIRAANDLIRKAGWTEDCYFTISDEKNLSINFSRITLNQPDFPDSVSFKLYTRHLSDLLVAMFKRLGYDFKLEYTHLINYNHKNASDTMAAAADFAPYYQAIYNQTFQYQLSPQSDYFPYRATFAFDLANRYLQVDTFMYTKPLNYPARVISPQTALDLNLIYKLQQGDTKKYTEAAAKFQKQYVPATSLPYANLSRDNKLFMTARLVIRAIYSGEAEDITELKPAWYVVTDYEDRGNFFEPDTGKMQWDSPYYAQLAEAVPESASSKVDEQNILKYYYTELGTIRSFDYDDRNLSITGFTGEFNLPVPRDSLQLLQNYDTIVRILLIYRHLGTSNYTLIKDRDFQPSDYYQKGFRLCYKGIEISGAQIILNYNAAPGQSYSVYFYLDFTLPTIPELLISPETALALTTSDDTAPFAFTERAAISGAVNYAPRDLYVPAEETAGGEPFYGYVKLRIERVAVPDADPPRLTHKLVWVIYPYPGAEFIVDAATGKILVERYWDTC